MFLLYQKGMKLFICSLLIPANIMYAQDKAPQSRHVDTCIDYIYQRPASFRSRCLQTLMAIAGKKNGLKKAMQNGHFQTEAANIPASLTAEFNVREIDVNDRKAWLVTPDGRITNKIILYIHGGGYISNMTRYDWNFVRELTTKTNFRILVADYPLAPSANYKNVYDYFDDLYQIVLNHISSDDVIFIGNSAGGGIALGFTQHLRDKGTPLPSKVILNSPWLDITMSNPEIGNVDTKDKLLSIDGLRMAGQAYAEDLDPRDPKVSPIYGDFSDIPPISLFIGTHDVFLPDARKLKQHLRSLNIPLNYYEYPKMFHMWMAVTNLEESKHAIDQMVGIIHDR